MGFRRGVLGIARLGWRAGIYGGWAGGIRGVFVWRNTLYMAVLSLLKMISTSVAYCAFFF